MHRRFRYVLQPFIGGIYPEEVQRAHILGGTAPTIMVWGRDLHRDATLLIGDTEVRPQPRYASKEDLVQLTFDAPRTLTASTFDVVVRDPDGLEHTLPGGFTVTRG